MKASNLKHSRHAGRVVRLVGCLRSYGEQMRLSSWNWNGDGTVTLLLASPRATCSHVVLHNAIIDMPRPSRT